MKRSTTLLGIFTLLLTIVPLARAQQQRGLPSDGKDFYVVRMPSSVHCARISDKQYEELMACSYYDRNRIEVHYFSPGGKEESGPTFTVNRGQFVRIRLDVSHMSPDTTGEVYEYTA